MSKRFAEKYDTEEPPLKARLPAETSAKFGRLVESFTVRRKDGSENRWESRDLLLKSPFNDLSGYVLGIPVADELCTDDDCTEALLKVFLTAVLAFANDMNFKKAEKFVDTACPDGMSRLEWFEEMCDVIREEARRPGILYSLRSQQAREVALMAADEGLAAVVAKHVHTVARAARGEGSAVTVESCPALRPGSRLLRIVQNLPFEKDAEPGPYAEYFFKSIPEFWINGNMGPDLCSDEEYENIRETFVEHAFRALHGLPEMDTEAKSLTVFIS